MDRTDLFEQTRLRLSTFCEPISRKWFAERTFLSLFHFFLQSLILIFKSWFNCFLHLLLFLYDILDDLLHLPLGLVCSRSLGHLHLQLLLLLFYLQCLYSLLIILAVQLLPHWTLDFTLFDLIWSLDECFGVVGKELCHFFLEIQVFVALDGLIILHSCGVKLD